MDRQGVKNGNISSLGNSTHGFPGFVLTPPASNGQGIEWKIDTKENNWRAIRIINDTHNLVYGEFLNNSWTVNDKENPTFHELYDLNVDFYQTTNLFPIYQQNSSMNGLLTELHQMLMTIGNCQGNNCFQ